MDERLRGAIESGRIFQMRETDQRLDHSGTRLVVKATLKDDQTGEKIPVTRSVRLITAGDSSKREGLIGG